MAAGDSQDGTNSYVYGMDLVASLDASNTRAYFLYDGLGSTTNLTDASGNNQVSYSYDAFGIIRAQTGSSPNQWLFTGEQRDADSGLYYLRARYYDPAIGRFLGRDALPATNLYAYVRNNPVNWIDPTGLHCKAWHPHHCVQDAAEEVAEAVEEAPNAIATATTDTLHYLECDIWCVGQIAGGAAIAVGCTTANVALCAGGWALYSYASLGRVASAGGGVLSCERIWAAGTSALGAIPVKLLLTRAIAGFFGAGDAIICATTAYSLSGEK